VLTGEVLMDEVKINADMKFEGIEMGTCIWSVYIMTIV